LEPEGPDLLSFQHAPIPSRVARAAEAVHPHGVTGHTDEV